MIHKSSIDKKAADHIAEIIHNESVLDDRAEAEEIMDYYLQNYEIVQVVRCDACHRDLCLEVLDPDQYTMNLTHYHHEGLRRIELSGSPLLASRKRLDGAMGYECKCGNNTLNSEVELGLIPSIKVRKGTTVMPGAIPTIQPHHEAAVALEIAKQHYVADIKINGAFKTTETFTTERIKGPAYAI